MIEKTQKIHRYIITGGPGSGKTSLLAALHRCGYDCSPEASRQLIMEGLAEGSACMPWLDLNCFAEKTLECMKRLHAGSAGSTLTFFDRGIPDIMAYLRAAGLPVNGKYDSLLKEYPYNKMVFLLPPWREIYVQDPARWQTFDEAEGLYLEIKETYRHTGHHLYELPKSSVDERVAFVKETLKKSHPL